MRPLRLLLLLLAWLPAACGDLPQPFLGNPGATARRLAQPPAPRLAIPPPPDALLSDESSTTFSKILALELQNQEVPAVQGAPQRGDWRLTVVAHQQPGGVVPVYTVYDPTGKDQGKAEGTPIPVKDWANASPVTLAVAATQVAPKIANLLSGIQTALLRANPNSLYNRPARVQVLPVTGAPGDGNIALTKQFRTLLGQLGEVVQDTADGADFVVKCQVRMVPIANNQQRVEIQWIVSTPSGDERGRVIQLNDVPSGSLDGYWGDVATAVAHEAAGGVRDVILRQSGHEPGAEPSAPASGTPATAPPSGAATSASPASAATPGK
jgi:hypothetical protein